MARLQNQPVSPTRITEHAPQTEGGQIGSEKKHGDTCVGGPGFISRGSPVQIRPPLVDGVYGAATLCHTPAHIYHGWPETSASQLKALHASPIEYYERFVAKTAPQKSGDSLSYGTLLHSWAEISDEEFWDRAVDPPAQFVTATGQLSKSAAAWVSEQGEGAIIIAPADREKLWAQTRQILANPMSRSLLENSIGREFNVRWQHEGHACRCRCDGATEEGWYDVKTTREVDPLKTFWRAVDDYHYQIQAAHYLSAAMQCGWKRHRMQFIATSTSYPYRCEVVYLPDALLRIGERQVSRLLKELDRRTKWESWLPDTYGQAHELQCPARMLGEEWT